MEEIKKEIIEKVILVAVADQDVREAEESLDELEELVKTAGAVVAARVIQVREAPHPGTYIGKGKIDEVKALLYGTDAIGIVCDDELSPAQMGNLSDALDTKVMDRTLIILDIFAKRAFTREGKIQVELAQLKYRASKLTGQGKALSRLGGGIGTRGPGEKKLEMDRRLIRTRISRLKAELRDVVKHREVQRKQRQKNHLPVVCIVGYTNAGKSTLLNQLTNAGIPANNRLFDTLDTTSRQLEVNDTLQVILSDTVGFISKLPHHLVDAFRATLEELSYADLLIHVIDASDPEREAHIAVVEQLVEQLAKPGVPVIQCFNKADLVMAEDLPVGQNRVAVSAKKGSGLEALLRLVADNLNRGQHRCFLLLPYAQGGILDRLHRDAQVLAVEYAPEGIQVEAICGPIVYGQLKKFVIREI